MKRVFTILSLILAVALSVGAATVLAHDGSDEGGSGAGDATTCQTPATGGGMEAARHDSGSDSSDDIQGSDSSDDEHGAGGERGMEGPRRDDGPEGGHGGEQAARGPRGR